MSRRPRDRRPGRAPASPARVAAVRTMLAVETGAHAEDMLAQLAPADGPDRGLAWHLVHSVLRRQGSLDDRIQAHIRQSLGQLDAPVRATLRVGAADLWLTRTPPHAAVHQAVETSRKVGAGRASALINAVMRKLVEDRLPRDPWLDLPPWLAQRWAPHEAWVARLGTPAPTMGVWRDAPNVALPHRATSAGGQPVDAAFELVDHHGSIDALPGFAEGEWWVMDASAAVVADLCEARGRTVLDACAAPGGKSLRLVASGAHVTATDLRADRLELVAQNAARTGLQVELAPAHDWLQGPHPNLGRFDVVLVDAPCTGLGTVRRHPEIKWRRLASDPAAMQLRQVQILRAAATHVAPGGRLIYAVCSPMDEEGIGVTDQLGGWQVERWWRACPPPLDEDAFQAAVLRQVTE